MLLGSRDFIAEARIGRKLLGGGMRQAGVLAAAGLVALEETPKILHRDHENARHLAEGIAQMKGVGLDPKKVVTNIVIFDVRATGRTADEMVAELEKHGILSQTTAKYSVRFVTHYDVDRAGADRAIAALAKILDGRASASAHS
jgi:threonine aldolase